LVVPDHAKGLPVLRALSLCTCCRHYPGTATGGTASLIRPVISAFPVMAAGSACASHFSRLAQRSLALRPAHSRCHQFVARFTRRLQTFRHLHACSGCFRLERCRAGLAPAGKRRLCTAHAMRVPSDGAYRMSAIWRRLVVHRFKLVGGSRPSAVIRRYDLGGSDAASCKYVHDAAYAQVATMIR